MEVYQGILLEIVLGGILVFLARYGIDVAPVPVLIKNETTSRVLLI